jgi:hypothetical protein
MWLHQAGALLLQLYAHRTKADPVFPKQPDFLLKLNLFLSVF